MSLRLLQITLPKRASWDVSGIIAEEDVIASWRDDSPHEHVVIHLLMSAEEAESTIDKIEERFGTSSDFRVILIPVEGVLPRTAPSTPSTDGEHQQRPSLFGARVCREELYADAIDSSKPTINLLLLTALSAIVASVGLVKDNMPVVIGAMVIAPLLGPNVSLAVGTALGDVSLVISSLRTALISILVATVVAILTGLIMEVDPEIASISRLTNIGFADLAIAFVAGVAGSLAFTSGLSRAVIGVMVAVALLPPLAAFGLLLGSGNEDLAIDALLLTIANIICINLAGVVTFVAQGVIPTRWYESRRARHSVMIASALWISLLIILVIIIIFK